jgi:hypothetical protein
MKVEITAKSFFDILDSADRNGIAYSFTLEPSTKSTPGLLILRVDSPDWTNNYPSFSQMLLSSGQVQTQYFLHYEEEKSHGQA